jgi:hypothetical protein
MLREWMTGTIQRLFSLSGEEPLSFTGAARQ